MEGNLSREKNTVMHGVDHLRDNRINILLTVNEDKSVTRRLVEPDFRIR